MCDTEPATQLGLNISCYYYYCQHDFQVIVFANTVHRKTCLASWSWKSLYFSSHPVRS